MDNRITRIIAEGELYRIDRKTGKEIPPKKAIRCVTWRVPLVPEPIITPMETGNIDQSKEYKQDLPQDRSTLIPPNRLSKIHYVRSYIQDFSQIKAISFVKGYIHQQEGWQSVEF